MNRVIFRLFESRKSLRYISILAALIFLCVSYFLIRGLQNHRLILLFVYVDSALIIWITSQIWRRLSLIFRVNSKNKHSRFHRQIITLFSGVTVIPAICVFIFSVLFFNVGIDNLFKRPIRNVITNAEQVSSIYVNDTRLSVERFTYGLGEIIINNINGMSFDTNELANVLDREIGDLRINAMIVQTRSKNKMNVLASSPYTLSIIFEQLPGEIMSLLPGGVISWETEELVVSAMSLNKELGIYLITSTSIDKTILDHKHKIKKAVNEYSQLMIQSAGLKFSFITLFSAITLLLLLLAILLGSIFARWILKPINELINATKDIALGNYNSHIKDVKASNEWKDLIGAFNDMIDRLEQQKQQLIISNKQNAWRDVARKIAHEIKNPLTPIQLSAERLRNKYEKEIQSKPEVFNTCIDTIIRQVKCIGNLVKEFSDFARMPAPVISKTDIIKLIRDVIILQSNSNHNIEIYHDLKYKEFFCNIDQSQINQVLMNLIQNAVNAINENNNGMKGTILVDFSFQDEIINVSIEDDGPGFSEEAVKRAFDPYFTTRELGTGLGLAIVHKIISDHFGEISIGVSEKLGGAKILIELPINLKNEVNNGI